MKRRGFLNAFTGTLFERWQILESYLRMKVEERDWHGVSDAANDLRELEAAHPELKE